MRHRGWRQGVTGLALALPLAGAALAQTPAQPTATPAPLPGSADWADVATIGGGVAAELGCAGVFVTGRPAGAVERDDVHGMNPLLGGAHLTVDAAARTVSASVLPGQRVRTAVYRPGVGCTLADALSPAAIAAQPSGVGDRPYGARPGRWPRGDGEGVEPLAAPVRERLDRAVAAAFDGPNASGRLDTRAIVVVQDGRIVAERYAPGFDTRSRFLGWSMSKSVTNALIGNLVADGKLALDAPAPVPEWADPADPRHAITLRQLLQMSSGLAFDDAHVPGDESTMLYARTDMAHYAAERPVLHPPGTVWNYSTGTTLMLSRLATRALGGGPATQAYLRRRVFDPIGMQSAVLEADETGTPVGGSYVYATARDWARFGLTYLQDGVAPGGRRVVSRDWVAFTRTPNGLTPSRNYGAQFWLDAGDDSGAGQRMFKDLPRDAFFALGHNMQIVAVVPSRRAVIVRMGWTPDGQRFDFDGVLAGVLAALP